MKFVAGALACIVFALPLAVSADAISELQAQVKVLQQVLANLQQQRGTQSAPAASACTALVAPLDPGATGAAVSQLQRFLARDTSIYPEGIVSGYYGPLTTAAVQRFQIKNNIVSSGSPSTTGYGRVGPQTLAVIAAQCGGTSAGGTASAPPANPDNVGGFIQVSPVSGPAPLYVSVQATVNSTNDCGAALYTVDFGDGSAVQQIQVPAGTCGSVQQTYTHTYSSNGSYSVTLSAGSHSSSAIVVVQPQQ